MYDAPHNMSLPICIQTISVRAPMNCGVAFRFLLMDSSSTILPIENHRADLSRYSKRQHAGLEIDFHSDSLGVKSYLLGFLVVSHLRGRSWIPWKI